MRLHPRAMAVTGATVAVCAYLLGAIVHVISPWGAPALLAYIFYIDLYPLARPFYWDGFFVGIAMFAGGGFILGWVNATMYNWLLRREQDVTAVAAPVAERG
jgi:hypothetical protein